MKMIIDIPDNELKVPSKNIHLYIDNGIITEVCIKKYDKDKDKLYFMNLNYIPLEECDDAISRQDALMALTGQCADSLIELLPNAIKRINELPPVKPTEKVGHWISNAEDDLKISEYTCSNCKGLSDEDSDFCPHCGAKMQ